MRAIEPYGSECASGVVLDPDEYIQEIYGKLEFNDVLEEYLNGESEVDDRQVGALLETYSGHLADAALSDSDIDIPIIRLGAELLTGSMNDLCRNKFDRPNTSVLTFLGLRRPSSKAYVRVLDDTYWEKQFPEEFRQACEKAEGMSDKDVLASHIQRTLYGLIFAPFSYMRG